MALALMCYAIKMYIRIFVHKKVWFDDLFTGLGLVLQVGYTALVINMFMNGGARHQWDMPIGKFQQILSVQNKLGIIQMATYLCVKLGLLLLYYRIFNPKPAFRWAIYAGCFVIVCAYIPSMFLFIFQHDINVLVPTSYGVACINLITDVYLCILPMTAVGSLHLPLAKKIGVSAIFGAGLLACAFSALSLKYRFEILDGTGLIDMTYNFSSRTAVLVVEIYVGIIVSCVPIFPALFRDTIVSKAFSTTFRSLRERLVGSSTSSSSHQLSGHNVSNVQLRDYHQLGSRGKASMQSSSVEDLELGYPRATPPRVKGGVAMYPNSAV
ncbi:hypothetical protein MMYC01_205150 [Madurella mycetomatis]|nr:hypothetical protein MMYC01_205150 [Madurella mycetomatis]